MRVLFPRLNLKIDMNFQEKVREFQIASGQPVSDVPYTLTKEELDFRDTLLREEIRELQYAIVDNNRVEILDALCDIKYVNDGTANMMGVKLDDSVGTPAESTYELSLIPTESVRSINASVYFLAGVHGFTREVFEVALNRVHESNMSKFCNDVKTAERTKEFYKKQGIDTIVEPREKKFVIYRSEDGKVLKSVDYYPVKLEDLV